MVAGRFPGNHLVFADDHLVRNRVVNGVAANAAADRIGQRPFDLLALVDGALADAHRGAAVVHRHDDVLSHVGQLARQIAGVGRLEGGVGQTLAGAVRRAEILQYGQPFAEIRLDRRLDDGAVRLGHQTAHTGQLANLLDAAAGAGVGHQEDRVQVRGAVAAVVLEVFHHLLGDFVARVRPQVDDGVVALDFGDVALVVLPAEMFDLLFRRVEDAFLVLRRPQIVGREAEARARRFAEAEFLHAVEQLNRMAPAQLLVAVGDDARQRFAGQGQVVKRHFRMKNVVEDHAADRGQHQAVRLARHVLDLHLVLVNADFADDAPLDRQPHPDAGVDAELFQGVSGMNFGRAAELLALAQLRAFAQFAARRRQVVAAHDDVLRRADNRLAVGRAEDVVGGHHQHGRLDLRLNRQRQVDGHLIAVEVGVEAFADQRMDADGVAFDQHRLEALDAHAVQRRRPIEQYRMVFDDFFEDVPNLIVLAFEHLLGRLDRVGVAQFLEPADDKRLEQFQRDLLRQTALMQPQFGADDDDRAGRVIDALAEQVFAETALLALDHVGQRLQRAIAGTEDRPFAAVVVEQARRPTAATSASRCG